MPGTGTIKDIEGVIRVTKSTVRQGVIGSSFCLSSADKNPAHLTRSLKGNSKGGSGNVRVSFLPETILESEGRSLTNFPRMSATQPCLHPRFTVQAGLKLKCGGGALAIYFKVVV